MSTDADPIPGVDVKLGKASVATDPIPGVDVKVGNSSVAVTNGTTGIAINENGVKVTSADVTVTIDCHELPCTITVHSGSATGNTATGNVAVGSNSGSGNIGVGNSGSGNVGVGNSGSGNVGVGNSGTGNVGVGHSGSGPAGTDPIPGVDAKLGHNHARHDTSG